VIVEAGGQRFTRLVSAGSGFASQQSARLYFGLGDKTQVDAVTVRWPRGRAEKFTKERAIAARQLVRITEGKDFQVLELPRPALSQKSEVALGHGQYHLR
jgi:hypothetical protein